MWILVKKGKTETVWSGNVFGVEPLLFSKYESPDKAQVAADSFHLASCNFNHQKARETVGKSMFVVRDIESGKNYTPPPLVKSNLIFARVK
jgi:hypothetical protein